VTKVCVCIQQLNILWVLQLANKIFKNIINLYIFIFVKNKVNKVCMKHIFQTDKKTHKFYQFEKWAWCRLYFYQDVDISIKMWKLILILNSSHASCKTK